MLHLDVPKRLFLARNFHLGEISLTLGLVLGFFKFCNVFLQLLDLDLDQRREFGV
jgi:hypothetical protein